MEARPKVPFIVRLHLDKGKLVLSTNELSGRPRPNVPKHRSSFILTENSFMLKYGSQGSKQLHVVCSYLGMSVKRGRT